MASDLPLEAWDVSPTGKGGTTVLTHRTKQRQTSGENPENVPGFSSGRAASAAAVQLATPRAARAISAPSPPALRGSLSALSSVSSLGQAELPYPEAKQLLFANLTPSYHKPGQK